MYDVLLILDDGEIRTIKQIKLISWTRSRIIFTDIDDNNYHYLPGRIVKCELEYMGG